MNSTMSEIKSEWISRVLLSMYWDMYFAFFTNKCLFHMFQAALQDLRTNPNISSLLPCFVNFVSNGVSFLKV